MKQSELYNNCLEEMYGLRRFGIKLGLETIGKILESLGNPHKSFKCIHVAGTNGKGSIASALASILHASGYKTGLYTSPHLVRFNERICINNEPVSDEDVINSYEKVKKVQQKADRGLTFFEYTTAMAFYEFARQKVEWAVIETGMGGRLDATNIIEPSVSIISNLSIEHTTYLGDSIAQIAEEKGGIIKENTPVVTGVRQKDAVSILKKIAQEKSAPFYHFSEDFKVERIQEQRFNYFGIENVWRDMQTGLQGSYQLDNAALVLAACEILGRSEAKLPLQCIKDGLEQNKWPGRLEIVSTSPFVVIDGAHNLDAAENLAKYLSENLSDRKLTLVVGILDDKPYTAILQSLLPVCNRVIITQPKIDRSLVPEKLSLIAKEMVSDVKIIADVAEAVKYAIKTASPEDAVCIGGSLYVVGEAKEALDSEDWIS